MASTRNVDKGVSYQLLGSHITGRSRLDNAQPLNEAMDDAVQKVPGGEYLMNVVVRVNGRSVEVTGDVYGVPGSVSKEAKLSRIDGLLPGEQLKVYDHRRRLITATFLSNADDGIRVITSAKDTIVVAPGAVVMD